MTKETSQIRALLAPIENGLVMVPGSVVAEVIELSDMREMADAPDWVVGEVDWQDWRVPVVSYALLGGTADGGEVSAKDRVLVIKSLAEAAGTPYIGILISGVPRLASVAAAALTEPDPAADFPCVFRCVTFEDQRVIIPDLDALVAEVDPVMSEA
ncbi:MAG: hypothetical protein HKN58_09700 [Xanthomonadales bacterium]|nr:hypothetical protein [Xanthomonadales bacterium]